jgi:valyl-tRNA synthetase
LAQTDARLADTQFVERAPATVVAAARERANELRDLVQRLEERLEA